MFAFNMISISLLVCSIFVYICFSEGTEDKFLAHPIPSLCSKRTIHVKSPADVNYFLSWRSEETKPKTWWDARNFCRKRCMETVSLETDSENVFIKYFIEEDKRSSVWTSGHLCDFKGCDEREDLQPIHLNGWFWAGSGLILGPADKREYNDWSDNGPYGVAQPDNQAYILSTMSENCIAMLNNRYNDGIRWHDLNCYIAMDFICEDSKELLKEAKKLRPKLKYII